MSKRPEFLAVDFFCGAGGTTRGLIDSGGYVIAGIDKDGRCRDTYVENNINGTIDYSPARFLERDIFAATPDYPAGEQDKLFEELSSFIDYYRGKAKGIPLLFAICAPCQPFTRLSRKEMSEERKAKRAMDRNLLSEAVKFVERFQPDIVLSENVASIKDPRYGGVWDDFRSALRELGYLTGSRVVCTSKFGIPQYRKRSILVAVASDPDKHRLEPEECADLVIPERDEAASLVTVAEVLKHLPPIAAGESHASVPNHRARALSELNLQRISAAKPGQPNSYMADTSFGDLSLRCHREVNERMSMPCFTDVYTRMHPDRPSPTITTKCHSISNGRFGHYDQSQNRGISLREAAVLQSFPDDYVFHPREAVDPVARMIGNAVPPKLAAFFASYALSKLPPRA